MELYGGGNISTNGLILLVDSTNNKSYASASSPSYVTNLVTGLTYSLVNGVTYNNRDFVFDGVDDYVNFGNFRASLSLPIYSVNIWFNSSSIVNYKNLMDFNTSNTMPRVEQYTATSTTLPGAGNASDAIGSKYARFNVNVTSADYYGFFQDFPPYTQMTQNYWYNLIWTWNNTTKNTRIFISGSKLVDKTASSNWNSGATSLKIGNGYDSSRYFSGKIPYFAIYNRAVTDTEALNMYNTLKHRFTN